MLTKGALRVLGANDPDPYPDAITVEAFAPLDDDGNNCVSVGGRIGKKGRQTKTARTLRAAIKKISA